MTLGNMRTNRGAVTRRVLLAVPPRGDLERRPLARSRGSASIRPTMVCTRCGIIGADAWPNWREQPQRESLTGVQWR
jgi:hypothetical protein